MLALCGSLCCLIAFTMSTLCLGKRVKRSYIFNKNGRAKEKILAIDIRPCYWGPSEIVQQILSSAGSPCIPNPNKSASVRLSIQNRSGGPESTAEKIGRIERLFLMGTGLDNANIH